MSAALGSVPLIVNGRNLTARSGQQIFAAMRDPARIFYRLRATEFRLHSTFLGDPWPLELTFINSANCWRCMLEGKAHWYIACGNTEAQLKTLLTETGFDIPERGFVYSTFRRLETLRLAERVHQNAASAGGT